MKIAVFGAGQVGGAVGRAWSAGGHDVVYGVPDPNAAKYAALAPARVTITAEAARQAGVILLATPWPAVPDALKAAGDLSGKVIIDATNPLAWDKERGLHLVIGFTSSGGEIVQGLAPSAHVVKTLNQAGFEVLGDAARFPARPVMFMAGDDADAKSLVAGLLADLAFEPVDAGAIAIARLLEPLAMVWINQAINRGAARDFAFGLVRPVAQ